MVSSEGFLQGGDCEGLHNRLAGLALILRISPKTSLSHALVAGFFRNLIMHNPGMVNFPFFKPSAPISAKAVITLLHCDFLMPSTFSDIASAIAVLDMEATVFFMGAMAKGGA